MENIKIDAKYTFGKVENTPNYYEVIGNIGEYHYFEKNSNVFLSAVENAENIKPHSKKHSYKLTTAKGKHISNIWRKDTIHCVGNPYGAEKDLLIYKIGKDKTYFEVLVIKDCFKGSNIKSILCNPLFHFNTSGI